MLSCPTEDLKIIADKRLQNYRKLFVSFCRLYLSIIGIFGRQNFSKFVRGNRKTLIPFIDKLILVSGINKKVVFKFLNISAKQDSRWKTMEQYACSKSLIRLCYKRVPRQISIGEITIMKKLMTDKTMEHWSSSSVWGFGVKQKMITMCRSTWYLYCKLLHLHRTRKKYKVVKKRISVRADYPNQIWHMDVSIYKTFDNIKYYVYTVVDNFSRKILAYDYSTELSADIRIKSLKSAVNLVSSENQAEIPNIDLIVDGGSENNNQKVSEFIKDCQINIHKKIALKDVLYSNSMIESTFRMLKSYYLKQGISSLDFPDELKKGIEDINYKRPHYAHLIYTPDEVYKNPELKNSFLQLQELKDQRIQENQNFGCDNSCKQEKVNA